MSKIVISSDKEFSARNKELEDLRQKQLTAMDKKDNAEVERLSTIIVPLATAVSNYAADAQDR